jgi:pimeloyl-ACP methyl ester carboxylesterase
MQQRLDPRSSKTPTQMMFLPGALGRTQLWKPVADLISLPARKVHVDWPGFGTSPPDPAVSGINDLVASIVARIEQPTALIAQSMGGVVAIRVALQKPDLITHLVLAVTSGGIDVARLGGQDWRATFQQANPQLPRWFADDQEDLTQRLAELAMPVLLLWGDADPISPVSVG